jgi:hypothetical protein
MPLRDRAKSFGTYEELHISVVNQLINLQKLSLLTLQLLNEVRYTVYDRVIYNCLLQIN